MKTKGNYKFTFYACCLGSVLQSCVVNVAPLLFIPLKMIYGFSYAQLGILASVNYFTQLICDFTLGGPADKYGVKKFFVSSPIFVLIGFLLFSLTPVLFPASPYTGFLVATVFFSIGGGLLELLVSPIVNALPMENKASAMSVVHGCYAWGQVGVVLITTGILSIFGKESWQFVYAFWALLALLLSVMFAKSSVIAPKKNEDKKAAAGFIFNPIFILAFIIMLGSGASEISISQWSSSFLERGLGLPKELGDILGMCGFAIMMGVGRTAFGKTNIKMCVIDVLIGGSFLTIVCYIFMSLSPSPVIGIVSCALCGLGVSLLWPCTLTIAAERFPLGGTLIFALLAGGGDVGCVLGSWLVGAVTDAVRNTGICDFVCHVFAITAEQASLRIGVFSGIIFPVITFVGLLIFKRIRKNRV